MGPEVVGDDELEALALAADPDQPIDPGAVPFRPDGEPTALLPEWYMPVPRIGTVGRRRRWAIAAIVLALVVINGAGLCVTYGVAEIAW